MARRVRLDVAAARQAGRDAAKAIVQQAADAALPDLTLAQERIIRDAVAACVYRPTGARIATCERLEALEAALRKAGLDVRGERARAVVSGARAR
jgi:hypothetical protein